MRSALPACWDRVPGRPVRRLVAGTPRPGRPELVVVPGLGALGYLLPTVRGCAGWTRVHLLDVPGFGHRRTARLPADLAAISRTVAAWLADVAPAPVLLFGHSTGAQAALRAALAQPDRVTTLVLGGATFPPEARRALPLLRRVVTTAAHERPGELPAVLPDYVRGARRLGELVRSTLADRPEEAVRGLRRPVVVLRGHRDGLCPPDWAEQLAGAAGAGRVEAVPGAHNFVFSHPVAASAALRACC